MILSGGAQYVFGAASGAVVSSGGNGGAMEVVSGGSTGSSAVTFSGGGELKLDASASFGGTVAGFRPGDFLDLADVAFGSTTSVSFTEATSTQSGTLTVTDGTHTASVLLLGQYTAGQFTLASDGHGGSLAIRPLPRPTTPI
jgi:hypothetical protein